MWTFSVSLECMLLVQSSYTWLPCIQTICHWNNYHHIWQQILIHCECDCDPNVNILYSAYSWAFYFEALNKGGIYFCRRKIKQFQLFTYALKNNGKCKSIKWKAEFKNSKKTASNHRQVHGNEMWMRARIKNRTKTTECVSVWHQIVSEIIELEHVTAKSI